MNDVRIVREAGQTYSTGSGQLYINGHKVMGVLSAEPNLTDPNEVASVTITLAVSTFTFAPADE